MNKCCRVYLLKKKKICLRTNNISRTTVRFLESDLIEIFRRSSKGPVGGAVHKWKLWPTFLLCTAPPAFWLLLHLPSAYCSSYCNGFFTAPPSPISLLLLPASDYGSFTAPPTVMVSLLLLLVQAGNTGCGVFKKGIQNLKGFWLKINCIKWNHWILRIGVMGRCQKVPKSDLQSHFSSSKIIRIFLIFFHWRIQI